MRVLKLIYPERRVISDTQVTAWARDVMIDNEISNLTQRIGATPADYVIEQIRSEMRTPALAEAIALLTDEGIATFERGRDAS